jgi:predicted RecB family nuclease
MEAIENEYGDLIIIHYATYEATRLNMLAKRYPTSLDGRDNRRRVERLRRRLLDLYRVLQRGLYLPFASYSIKDVAPGLAQLPSPGGPGTEHCWLKFEDLETLATRLGQDGWSDDEVSRAVETLAQTARDNEIDVSQLLDASANMSVFWYEQYCGAGEPIWRHLINVYNADDLVATQRLYDYLLRLHRNGLEGIDRATNAEFVETNQ